MKTDTKNVLQEKNPVRYCANCHNEVHNEYCSICGQSLKDMYQSFWKILIVFFGEAFSLDGKFFHTLKVLIIKPWVLTRDFMNGKRICYTPPFRMYLFASFFMFLLLAGNYSSREEESILKAKKTEQSSISISETTSSKHEINATDNAKNHFLNTLKKISAFADAQPFLFIDIALKKVSQALFVLFPFFALLLALFYYRQKRYFIEHLLLSLHFHTFIFIVFIIVLLLNYIPFRPLNQYTFLIYLLIPIQLYRILKNHYQQSTKLTIAKFTALSFCYNLLFLGIIIIGFALVVYKFW